MKDRLIAGKPTRSVPFWAAFAAGVLYSVPFHKYSVRNALETSTGVQGELEFLSVALACGLMMLCTRRMRAPRGVHPAVLWFAVYGVLVAASFWRSFSPVLSAGKAVMFGCALLMAYLVARSGTMVDFFSGAYFGFVGSVALGLACCVLMPGKFHLTETDIYSGRTQLTVWATHPNQLAEVSGLLFLVAMLLPLGSRWYTQLFLLGLNFFAGEKTSAIALLLTTPAMLLAHPFAFRRRLGLAVLAAALVVPAVLFLPGDRSPLATHGSSLHRLGTAVYGSQVYNEMGDFDGRTAVWKRALSLGDRCLLLGFGFEGARQQLMQAVSWGGHAHNQFLQAMLSAGVPGALAFLLGIAYALAGSLGRSWAWNVRVLALAAYLFIIAMTGPVFDEPVFLAEVALVEVLYFSLHRRRVEAMAREPVWQPEESSAISGSGLPHAPPFAGAMTHAEV